MSITRGEALRIIEEIKNKSYKLSNYSLYKWGMRRVEISNALYGLNRLEESIKNAMIVDIYQEKKLMDIKHEIDTVVDLWKIIDKHKLLYELLAERANWLYEASTKEWFTILTDIESQFPKNEYDAIFKLDPVQKMEDTKHNLHSTIKQFRSIYDSLSDLSSTILSDNTDELISNINTKYNKDYTYHLLLVISAIAYYSITNKVYESRIKNEASEQLELLKNTQYSNYSKILLHINTVDTIFGSVGSQIAYIILEYITVNTDGHWNITDIQSLLQSLLKKYVLDDKLIAKLKLLNTNKVYDFTIPEAIIFTVLYNSLTDRKESYSFLSNPITIKRMRANYTQAVNSYGENILTRYGEVELQRLNIMAILGAKFDSDTDKIVTNRNQYTYWRFGHDNEIMGLESYYKIIALESIYIGNDKDYVDVELLDRLRNNEV